jgi:prepilin-type N-terminal cleavage/methylation domain-containing protein
MKRNGRFGDERGFSLLEVAVAAGIISIVLGMAVFGLRSARAAMRLNNSARVFAQNVERARLDAIRRHDSANVEFIDSTTYEITMDYTGSGVKTTRTYTLDDGVTLVDANGNAIADQFPYADFDWRGRTSECAMIFQMKNAQNDALKVQVAGSGDITVNNNVTNVPSITVDPVSATADVAQNTISVGTDTRLNLSPCSPSGGGGGGGGGGSVPGGGTVVAACSAGTLTATPQQVTIRRNGGSTATITATVTATGTLAASTESNLSLTAGGQQTFNGSSGGSVSYTVRSLNRTRGTFPVKFTFANCAPVTAYVKVTN